MKIKTIVVLAELEDKTIHQVALDAQESEHVLNFLSLLQKPIKVIENNLVGLEIQTK